MGSLGTGWGTSEKIPTRKKKKKKNDYNGCTEINKLARKKVVNREWNF